MLGQENRRDLATTRFEAGRVQARQIVRARPANYDDAPLPRAVGSFTKGLAHTQLGEADAAGFQSQLAALTSGKSADFEAIRRGSGRKLANPQAAFASHLEGGDPRRFACPPAPRLSKSGRRWGDERTLLAGAVSRHPVHGVLRLAHRQAGCRGPERFASRCLSRSDRRRPLRPLHLPIPLEADSPPLGTLGAALPNRHAGLGLHDNFGEWLQIQDGVPPWRVAVYDETPRYIRSGRDLAEWVHYDYGYEPFLHAALILLNRGPDTILYNNPFYSPNNAYKRSKVQEGWVTFGAMEVVDWVGRVTTAALKAAWAQKWLVHLRLRPEEFGGRLHQVMTGNVPLAPVLDGPAPGRSRQRTFSENIADGYPIHPVLLESEAVEEVFRRTGAYLLPQAFPEGCPLHPSYPAGHATVAGACSVVLKALFDESALIPDCVEASPDGLSLMQCPSSFAPTVGAEVNKLAFNIAMGRDWAGIHYRSDANAGLRLGEDVAISILQDLIQTYHEPFDGFDFTRFDGTRVHILPMVSLR